MHLFFLLDFQIYLIVPTHSLHIGSSNLRGSVKNKNAHTEKLIIKVIEEAQYFHLQSTRNVIDICIYYNLVETKIHFLYTNFSNYIFRTYLIKS